MEKRWAKAGLGHGGGVGLGQASEGFHPHSDPNRRDKRIKRGVSNHGVDTTEGTQACVQRTVKRKEVGVSGCGGGLHISAGFLHCVTGADEELAFVTCIRRGLGMFDTRPGPQNDL